jgi:PKD repeat protein
MRILLILVALLLITIPLAPGSVSALAAFPMLVGGTPPVLQAALTASTDAATPGQAVTFSYSAASLDSTDPVRTLTLDFGDGQAVQLPITTTGTTSGTIDHTYTQTRPYTVTLRVVGEQGVSATAAVSLGVNAPDTTAAMPVNQLTTNIVGLPVSFTAEGSTANSCGSIESYEFDFGDGSPPVVGQTVSHIYLAPGTYTVLLTVTDCAGVTATSLSSITILPAP